MNLDSLSIERKSDMLRQVIDGAVWCSDILRKGFLQIFYKNGLKITLLIQTDRTHTIIIQLPTDMQLDIVERRVRRDSDNLNIEETNKKGIEYYTFGEVLKKFDCTQWIIEESIIDGFKQHHKTDTNETKDLGGETEQAQEIDKKQTNEPITKRVWESLGHVKVTIVKDNEDK